MRLISLSYIEAMGTPQEWCLENLSLKQKNLLVGRNATGKSRTLNVIHALSQYLTGSAKPIGDANFTVHFSHNDILYVYELKTIKDIIISEKLTIGNEVKLNRWEGGKGEIFAENILNGSNVEFQSPPTDVAVASRRDSIQHSFLEPLHLWASSLRYYPFNTFLGKDLYIVAIPGAPKVDEKDSNQVVGIFREAVKQFPGFEDLILKDMKAIGYKANSIGLDAPISIRVSGFPSPPMGLYVTEDDLPGITDQFSMSTGMFRAISLLIHINFFILKKLPASVLIDDIGEGLDFERSCLLIDLLRDKSNSSDIQIIFSSNDKFIMNKVPLEEWSVLRRVKNKVHVHNVENSSEIFEEFKFTGLSNFSIIEHDFINSSIN